VTPALYSSLRAKRSNPMVEADWIASSRDALLAMTPNLDIADE
jgi:hypothetical protein